MNRIFRTPWILLVAALALAGCERAAAPEPFPQAVADAWVAAFNSGDAAGLALLYSPKAELLPPNAPVVSGHAAIEEFWKTANPGTTRIKVSTVEISMFGDFAFRQGTYETAEEGLAENEFGKFIELWRKIDSAWFIYRQMWSSNAPPGMALPPAEAAPAAG